ncbi:MAG: cbb3-type cytochrome c oxidase N-terminal domain-containing protein [Vicingaceae bacterium]
MKSTYTKLVGFIALMITMPAAHAQTGEGIAINDTMIFSLFMLMAVVFLMIIYAQVAAMKGILENRKLWDEKSNGPKSSKSAKAGALLVGLMLSQGLYAQGEDTGPLVVMTDQLYWLLISINAFLLGIIITLYFVTKGIVSSFKGEEDEAEELDVVASITSSLTDAVPIEQEGEIMLDHNYDGIRELDNNLPPWWKYGFYFTIVFGVVYLVNYHVVGSGQLQLEEYADEMAVAEEQKAAFMAEQANLVDESNLVVLEDASRLQAGKAIYVGNCLICHGENAEGVVGPNLTDEYWKHGGGIKNVYNVIKNGVVEKGMISWSSQLSPGQMLEVSSYILSLQGTNPPNAKPAEGEIWVEESTTIEPATEEVIEQEEVQSEAEA